MKQLFIFCIAFWSMLAKAEDISNSGLVFQFPLNQISSRSSSGGTVSNWVLNNGGSSGVTKAYIKGTVTLCPDRFGRTDSACEFDGTTGFIDIPYTTGLGTGDFTISYWAYTDAPGGLAFSKDRSGGTTAQFRMGLIPYYLESNMGRLQYKQIPSVWSFYVLRRFQSKLTLYVNGVVVDTTTSTVSPDYTNNSYTYRIGARHDEINSDLGVNFFKGKIDDVRLYSRAITDEEIQTLYGYKNDGLMAYFPFNGNLQDHSPNKNKVIAVGVDSMVVDRAGHKSAAAAFNGLGGNNCMLQIANSQTSFNVLPLTISVWFKANSLGAGTIISKYMASSSNGYQLTVENGALQIWYYKDASNCISAYKCYVPIDTIKWHHCTAVFNYSGASLFLDGKKASTASWFNIAQATESQQLLNIGHYASGGAFNGSLDELKIYNRSLTDAEIRDEYSNGLIAYYPFNATANDESGHGANGTLVDALKISTTTDRFGKKDSSYLFKGSFIEIKDSTKNNLDTSFTIAAWVNSNSTASSAIVSKYYWGNPVTGTNGYFFSMEDGGTIKDNLTMITNGTNPYYLSNKMVPLNRWSFVCAVYSPDSVLKIYMNDTLLTTQQHVKPSIANKHRCHIGAYYKQDGPFHGQIDDVRLYKRPLDSAEVSTLYHENGWMGQEVQLRSNKTIYCIGEQAILSVSNALPKTKYLWTTPEKTNFTTATISITVGKSAWYKVKISNQWFTRVDSIFVKMYDPFTPSIRAEEKKEEAYQLTDKLICKNDTIKLTATGDSVSWSQLVKNGIPFTFSHSQTYTVTAYYGNKKECKSNATIALTVTELSNILVIPQPETICLGDSVKLFMQGASHYFSKKQPAENRYFKPSVIGRNYIPVTGVDDNGCQYTDSAKVIVNDIPRFSLPDTMIVCTGSQTLLQIPNYIVTWDNGVINGKLFTPQNQKMYHALISNERTSCQTTDSVFITMKDEVSTSTLQITTKDSVLCIGDSTQLIVDNAFSKVLWSTGQEANAIWIKPNTATTYSASGIESLGCRLTDTIRLSVNALPALVVNKDTTICSKTSFTPRATGAKLYVWNNGAKNNQAIELSDDKTFTVTAIDSNACQATASVSVSVLKPYNEQLGIVTYNDNGNGMLIAWTPTAQKRTAQYKLLRLNPYSKYDTIYTCNKTDQTLFLDTNVDPSRKPYTYKLVTIDSLCGNKAFSVAHTSILSTSYISAENAQDVVVGWNQYDGLSSNEGTFYRLRVYNAKNQLIDSVDCENTGERNNQYLYKGHQSGNKYRVSLILKDSIFIGKLKTDTGPFSQSLSNMSEASLVSQSERSHLGITAYPNPTNDKVTVNVQTNQTIDVVSLTDATGREIQLPIAAQSPSSIELSLRNLPKGIYTLQIPQLDNQSNIRINLQ